MFEDSIAIVFETLSSTCCKLLFQLVEFLELPKPSAKDVLYPQNELFFLLATAEDF